MFDPTNSEKYVSNMHRGAEYLHPGIASISFIKVWMTCDAPLFCLCAPSFLHDYNRDMLYSTELLWSILRHMEWTFIATRTSTIGSRYLFFLLFWSRNQLDTKLQMCKFERNLHGIRPYICWKPSYTILVAWISISKSIPICVKCIYCQKIIIYIYDNIHIAPKTNDIEI